MTGSPAGSQQDHVETQLEPCQSGVLLQKGPGGGGQTTTLPRPQRFGRLAEVGALLDLDDGQRPPAPRDQVDLAGRGSAAPGQDPVAFEAQPPGGQGLGAATPPPGLAALAGRHGPVVTGRPS